MLRSNAPQFRTLLFAAFLLFSSPAWSQSRQLHALTDAPKWKVLNRDRTISHALRQLAEERRTFALEAIPARPFRSDNALARYNDEGVYIEAIAATDGNELLQTLLGLGLTDGRAFQRVVNGRLPWPLLANGAALEQLPGLLRIGLAHRPESRAGATRTQGDIAQNSDWLRGFFNLDGSGVTVGILSDSYDNLGGAAAGIVSGDLPGPGNPSSYSQAVDVLFDVNGSDEGRAMAEIVHDIAPGAGLAFHTAVIGRAAFADGIIELATTGLCDVIVDDIGYLNSPFFQDGIIAQTVDQVTAMGVTYFSAAGNAAANTYEAVPVIGDEFDIDYTESRTGMNYQYKVNGHAFGAGDYFQSVTVPAGGVVRIVLQWADPFTSVGGLPGAQTDIDLFLVEADEETIINAAIEDNNNAGDAVELIGYSNNTGADVNLNLFIGLVDGPVPAFLKLIFFGDLIVNEYDTPGGTCYGQPNAEGAIAVGAAFFAETPNFGTDPPLLEPFSSHGGIPLFFNPDGSAIAEPFIRQKPEIVCPDGGDNTFFGADIDQNGFFNFFGTSAAAPHAAGIAALLLELNPGLSPAEVESLLAQSAVDMGPAGVDLTSGYGLADALLAGSLAAQCVDDITLSAVSQFYPLATFYAKNTLTANLLVNTDFHLRAEQQVRLVAGFRVLPGVNFSAAIDAVNCADPELLVGEESQTGWMVPLVPEVVRPEEELSGDFALRSEPNPFRERSRIHFQLPNQQKASLRLVDLTGNTVREIVAPQVFEAGPQQALFTDPDLPAGLYYLVLETDDGRESRPFVKL